MKKFLSIFLLLLVLGCIQKEKPENWNIHVINGGIEEYSLSELKAFRTDIITETVVEEKIRKVPWEGVPSTILGDGEIINYISEDRYLVSVPSTVEVVLAYKKEGEPIAKKEGGPLKIAVDPDYGCKCNWLKYLKIVEFVDRENSLSIYGKVFNILYFSSRDLNLFYSLEDLIENTYHKAPLNKILEKAICKDKAETAVFITEEGRKSFELSKIKSENPDLIYEGGFNIPALDLTDIRGIKIE
ncbi:MAG: molybdopterin-dependent oxidoreductase [Euryarchaeota archaeon]|nr:molybdopterin-dependent oxidoreductase [Euryarchaeota archaeon]